MLSVMYFNPRSREGSDTAGILRELGRMNFNPRSREGSDDTAHRADRFPTYFNPRSREGSDWMRAARGLRARISIHAPVKGATNSLALFSSDFEISIHAPVKGATITIPKLKVKQSYFNPRSREGSDQGRSNGRSSHRISIHAPVKGATGYRLPFGIPPVDFNPRSREGSDQAPDQLPRRTSRFQSTLP